MECLSASFMFKMTFGTIDQPKVMVVLVAYTPISAGESLVRVYIEDKEIGAYTHQGDILPGCVTAPYYLGKALMEYDPEIAQSGLAR